MAKYACILLMMACVFSTKPLSACDICGCSTGNYFIGPFPQFNKHFIGMRYSYRNFNTVLNSDDLQFSKDHYQTTELLLGTQIKRKWQLLAFVPYAVNHSVTDDGQIQNSGPGDVTLMGSYNLFNKVEFTSDTDAVQQQFWMGGGVKLPTGKFSPDQEDFLHSVNSQPGTGSVDFLMIATYFIRIQKWAFSSNGTYKLNRVAHNFQFGNRFAANAFFSRSFNCGAVLFNPNVGMLCEKLEANKFNKEEIDGTGGSALLGAVGMEMRIKNFAVGGNVQIPVRSNLSAGQTQIKSRGVLQLSYTF